LEKFKETDFYKIYVSSLINVLFSVIGNTVGIWAGYLIISFILDHLIVGLRWPGLLAFIKDGAILLISFSFLTTALYASTRRLKINFFNSVSVILLVVNLGFYIRVIVLKQNADYKEHYDGYVLISSYVIFYFSLVLLYIILAREKYIENNSDTQKGRNSSYLNLKSNFNSNK